MGGRITIPNLHKALLVVGKLKMTYQKFEERIKKKNWFDRYWYFGLCILTIALSLTLLFFLITKPDKFKGNHTFHYSCFTFLFLMGTYGLYKLPNRFKIITIDSLKSLDDKKEALKNTIVNFGSTPYGFNDNYYLFRYQKSFWLSSFDIHLYYDEKQVCFSVQGHGSTDGGFIDFGGTERLRRRIKEEIEMYLD
ncbi:MAG: hypothetical protein J0L83_10645 [Chitinophagales bacterium]|nr:hypothetical protein [Chitinophagales bacterium]